MTTSVPVAVERRTTSTPHAVPTSTTRSNRDGLRRLGLALPIPVAILALWWVAVQQQWQLPFGIDMRFLSDPVTVAGTWWGLAFGSGADSLAGSLWRHVAASALRVLNGFLLAAALAVPLGILMGRLRVVRELLDSTIGILRPIPVTAWAPLSLLLIGYGDRSTIFLVFLAAFFPILINTIAGAHAVPPRLLEAARMLGVRRARVLIDVVLPSAMPSIIAGLRVALGLAWVVLVVGETVGITTGLGALITQARDMSRTDVIIAGMLTIGVAGMLSDLGLRRCLALATRDRPGLT